jgi:hypothetical protein
MSSLVLLSRGSQQCPLLSCSCHCWLGTVSQLKVEVMLRPMVSWSVCHGVKHPSGAPGPDFYCCQTVVGLLMVGTLSDERTGVPFTIAAGPQ